MRGRWRAFLAQLSAALFLPIRRLFGPLHRRRPRVENETTRGLPTLPPPWAEDDRWFRGGTPPRANNDIVPLIHGDEYFDDLCAALRAAQHRVTICGWCLTPLMALARPDGQATSILLDVLRDAAQRAQVYVLLWAGAPVLFEPDRSLMRDVRRTLLDAVPGIRCELDEAPFSHDHHQKAITVDGTCAYVGGMDLTTFAGDRWDTMHHPLRFGPNWHDVQVRIRGEAVRDVESNFCERWNAVTGERVQLLPVSTPDPAWSTPAQVVRTVPKGFYGWAPHGEFGIAHAYLTAIRRAERFVYLENQYLWSPEIVDALSEAMNKPRVGPFRVVLVLPADAYDGRYDNDVHVRQLYKADAGRHMFHAYSIYASGPAESRTGYQYRPIYVHAKVGIIDDEWFTVGSANLNGRGLATDTEMNVQVQSPEGARALRVRLWAEHLGMQEEEVARADPIYLIDQVWHGTAERVTSIMAREAPPPLAQVGRYHWGRSPRSRFLDAAQDVTLEH